MNDEANSSDISRPNSIPNNWENKCLADIAIEFISGGTPSTKELDFWDGEIPWTTSAPIYEQDVLLKKAQRFITQRGLKSSASNIVPKGNLIVGTRVGVGKAVTNTIDMAISQDLTGVVLDYNKVQPEYLSYYFKTLTVQQFFNGRKRGTTIKGISRFDLQSLVINLPPLPEQRAISRVLRAVQGAREARLREIALERERKAALMEQLFTHGTRGEATKIKEIGEMPESWKMFRLGEVFDVQLGKMLSSKARKGISPRPYLRNSNVRWGKIDLSDLYEMDFSDAEAKKFELKYGDVLVCEGGEIGRTAIWRNEMEGCYYQKAVHRLRPKNNLIIPEYFLYYFMMAFIIRNTYGVSGTKTTIAHLPAIKLKMLKIPIPNMEEQKEISSVLGNCDLKITAIEQEALLLDELFRAMLEELMSGKLPVTELK